MASTYTPIATYTVPSATSSYTFTSISSAYTDIVLVFNGTTSTDNDGYFIQLNSDSGSNYSNTVLTGNGSSATSSRSSNTTSFYAANNSSSSSPDTFLVQFQNYSNATTYKTMLARLTNTPNRTAATVGLWRSTSAINSIKIMGASSNLNTGCTITLYGIKAA
jgi:hypothetical protein